MKTDVHERITSRIVAELEQGVRPWLKPWNAEHAAGRITRPLRFNGLPYQGINVLMLWGEAVASEGDLDYKEGGAPDLALFARLGST